MMDVLLCFGLLKICVDRFISVHLLMLQNISIRKYHFLGVMDVSLILSSPLYSSWLGYSTLTRATRVQVPAMETWSHVCKKAKIGMCDNSQTQLVVYDVSCFIYHIQSHKLYWLRIMSPISYYPWLLHNSSNLSPNTCSRI